MKLSRLDIYNFRKLKKSRIDIADKKTIFVGANNSGKTSAMNCLMLFFGKSKDENSSHAFSPSDFTLPNWLQINEIGKAWEDMTVNESIDSSKLLSEWDLLLPQLDVWIEVSGKELHHINKIIPSLDWEGGKLGVRLRFEPKKIEDLFNDFRERRAHIKNLERGDIELWPNSLLDFLKKGNKKGNKLNEYFEVKAYILPSELFENEDIDNNLTTSPLDFDPFKGLVRIDCINAQRGFSDANDKDTGYESLSKQLRKYYERHLTFDEFIEVSDLDAIKASEDARKEFDTKIGNSFKKPLGELENLNYPAFGNPNINIACKVNPIDSYNHDSAVLFDIFGEKIHKLLKLSEKHNGLGYQNLISMTFKLMAFRDAWMKVGKAGFSSKEKDFEPLHIVLIEEPEAHLHAQVQQVFIKEAYNRLRDHDELGDKPEFCTQIIVSTHSNHIVEQVEFSSLRYFKRSITNNIPISTVVNLSDVFGGTEDTIRFAKRYLKLTHADLFFADAVILVEGQAERLLIPQFIKKYYRSLDWAYISLLEIGGSHAHTLQPLIVKLGIITLIVADIDAVLATDKRVKAKVEKGQNLYTRSSTLKKWLPKEEEIDKLLVAKKEDKETSLVKVAYQCPKTVELNSSQTEVLPNTFEDALIFENENIIALKKYGERFDRKEEELKKIKEELANLKKEENKDKKEELENSIKACEEELEDYKNQKSITKIIDILKSTDTDVIKKDIYDAISNKNFPKAEFALDLLYLNELRPPQYIKEGLEWLLKTLDHNYKKQKNE